MEGRGEREEGGESSGDKRCAPPRIAWRPPLAFSPSTSLSLSLLLRAQRRRRTSFPHKYTGTQQRRPRRRGAQTPRGRQGRQSAPFPSRHGALSLSFSLSPPLGSSFSLAPLERVRQAPKERRCVHTSCAPLPPHRGRKGPAASVSTAALSPSLHHHCSKRRGEQRKGANGLQGRDKRRRT